MGSGCGKGTWRRGYLKAALLYTRLKDMHYRKLVPYDGSLDDGLLSGIDNYAINTNAGEAWVRGLELAVSVPLTTWLTINASYSYVDSKLVKDNTGTGLLGTKLRYVPEHIGSIGLYASHGKLSGSLTTKYTGKQFGSEDNSDIIRGIPGGYSTFWLTNARMQYEVHNGIKLFVNLDNITNKLYYEFYRAPGRSVSMGASANF